MKNKTKKLACIFGSIVTTVVPLSTVIACSSNEHGGGTSGGGDAHIETEIEKYKREIETLLKNDLKVQNFQNTTANAAYEQWNSSTSSGTILNVERIEKGNDGKNIPTVSFGFIQKLRPNNASDLHYIIGTDEEGLLVANFNSDGTIKEDVKRIQIGTDGKKIPSVSGGFIQKLKPNDDSDLHFIIGTKGENGVLVVNFNTMGSEWAVQVQDINRIPVGTDGLKIPNVEQGFIQKLKPNDDSDLHFVIGTKDEGVLVANFNDNGTAKDVKRVVKGDGSNQIPRVFQGFIQKLIPNDNNDLHFVIGTRDLGALVANFNTDGTIKDVHKIEKGTGPKQIPDVTDAFIQKFKPTDDSDLHFIMGTKQEGTLVVNFNTDGTIKDVYQVPKGTGPKQLPIDSNESILQKLKPSDGNDLHFIIGSYLHGSRLADFNTDGTIKDVHKIDEGYSGNQIPPTTDGFIQKLKPNDVDDLHYIIGTANSGLLVANMLPLNLKVEVDANHLKITLGDLTTTIDGFKAS